MNFDVLDQADAIKAKIEELPSAEIGERSMWWDFRENALSVCVGYNPKTDNHIGNLYCFYVREPIELTDEWLRDLERKMHDKRMKFWKEHYNIVLPDLDKG